jgi:hypothetical protein
MAPTVKWKVVPINCQFFSHNIKVESTKTMFSVLFKKNVKCENIFQKVIIMINPSFQKNKREITLPYLSSENEMGSGKYSDIHY